MQQALAELKSRWEVYSHLRNTMGVLHWDQRTYMPPGGAQARGGQVATLTRLAQEQLVDPEVGRLIERLEGHLEELHPDSDEARLIQVARRDYDRATKVPPELIGEFYQHTSESYQHWSVAKEKSDFSLVRDDLAKTLDLSRRIANCFQPYDHIADPLIDQYDPDLTAQEVRAIFADLRPGLVELLAQIMDQPQPDRSIVRRAFPVDAQLAMTHEVVQAIGYDFQRGRLDMSPHPFTTIGPISDVRITSRFSERDLTDGLYSSLHEAGHGMYEQGIAAEFEGTPLTHGASFGVHESQSRLWENLVGRSRGFLNWLFPLLQERFPEQLEGAAAEDLYRAVNPVRPSLIRVDADEVTYNLHIMIRFDLELQMLEGALSIDDLPEAWADRYEMDLGVRPRDHQHGVLQDVHWYSGTIGGVFQSYTLGNILSAQFYQAAVAKKPDMAEEIESGEFGPLRAWLQDNIYRHGRKFTTAELTQRVTGEGLTVRPYLKHLQAKFGELYSL